MLRHGVYMTCSVFFFFWKKVEVQVKEIGMEWLEIYLFCLPQLRVVRSLTNAWEK